MKLNAGLFVILIVALLLVVGPFCLLMGKLWRSGKTGKAGSCLSVLAVVGLAAGFFADEPVAGAGSFEENLVFFLGTCGFLFYSIVGLLGIVILTRRALTKWRADSTVNRGAK